MEDKGAKKKKERESEREQARERLRKNRMGGALRDGEEILYSGPSALLALILAFLFHWL